VALTHTKAIAMLLGCLPRCCSVAKWHFNRYVDF